MKEPWNYQFFTRAEMSCSWTGKCEMDPTFMLMLDSLRLAHGKPIRVSSAYRDPSHPSEAVKPAPGWHTKGKAADLLVSGEDAYKLLRLALSIGFTGIGVKQTGPAEKRFLHVDTRPTPAVWSYPTS